MLEPHQGPGRSRPAAGMAMDDMNSQAFWNEFMRRPDAKAAYQAERRLQEKKKKWLEDRREIEERGERRKKVADALEECPADIKKLIAPMFHIRVVEQFLWMVLDECEKNKGKFSEQVRDERHLSHLRRLRENYQAGGEARMEEMEKEWKSLEDQARREEEKKIEHVPQPIDIHTLKHVLEYAQECKRSGNEKFKEGLYEEALEIYGQADEVMKKWKVDKHMKNEHKWLKDYHLACLKNKSQAALKLELFQTALEAAEAALAIDEEDHKAWYRKVQAQKGLGAFKDAEESLTRLEDVAQWCQDRRRILRDCEQERKRIKYQKAKHKESTQSMLGKAFQAGIFSGNREQELEDATIQAETEPPPITMPVADDEKKKAIEEPKPLERKIHLTAALAGDLMEELAEAYSARWFQEKVRKCARDSGYERSVFLIRLKDIAFQVQRPLLEKWGFEGSEQGVREMTAAIRDHAKGDEGMPEWLKRKQDRCLELLYGGKEAGMLDILTAH